MSERIIELDWNSVVLAAMLLFLLIGLKNGWQRGLVTLVSLFFAWGVALKTVNFLIRATEFVLQVRIDEGASALFQILLYLASALMVIVTFNSTVIQARVANRRDQIAGISTGLLNGYFFVVLLLDLGRDWFATHLEGFTFVWDNALSVDGLFREATIVIEFLNNPYAVYDQLTQAQNLVLLSLLLVFFHGLLFWLLGGLDRRLRTPV